MEKKTDILVIGSGGREHAVCTALGKSPRCGRLFCAPGNGGIASVAKCVDIKATDIEGVKKFAVENNIDLVFVTPDDPLVLGMVDELEKVGIKAFGPNRAAARIEGSKVFSKALMNKYGIPTAKSSVFSSPAEALAFIRKQNTYPAVIKADGLALGKGVIIASNDAEAEAALRTIMIDKIFGNSGNKVVIEEFLTGPEVSVLAFCDGKTVVPMVSSMDHKRAGDGDTGPNTGGMGAFSPSPHYTPEVEKTTLETIVYPTVDALIKEGCPFKGVIYFGLMITPDGPKVIEYNARFGDPETQVVLPRLESDLLDIVFAVIDGTLSPDMVRFSPDPRACVVAASGGYPGKYEKGKKITGIESVTDGVVFHAGTVLKQDGYYTNGGRVLCVSCSGKTLHEACENSYRELEKISFDGMMFRHDIGKSCK
ncbi:MAG: phosphoribosylamine--glycine ligase [Clostridia bacterium]|nr:phosphoribosylamine--glycine ligase [Clostridia bacterium]